VAVGARAQVWVRADEDPFAATYGRALRAFPVGPDVVGPGRTTGGWLPQRLITNLPRTDPRTRRRLPVEYQEVGLLRAGSTDPAAAGYDNRNAWAVDGDSVQLRLPWAAVGIADPSSRQALDLGPDGVPAATAVERLGLTVLVGGDTVRTAGYTWEPWDSPRYRERLKQGSEVLATAVRALN
jgi:hypothetical protein